MPCRHFEPISVHCQTYFGCECRKYAFCTHFGSKGLLTRYPRCTLSDVPRVPESEPTAFSKAVTAAIRRLKADRRASNADIAAKTTLSANYIAERLRDEKSFTLSDMEELGDFFGFEPGAFLVQAAPTPSNVRELRPNVGGYVDDALHGLDTAAGTDETQADED